MSTPSIGQTVLFYEDEEATPRHAVVVLVEEDDDEGRISVLVDGLRVNDVWQNSNDDPEGPFWRDAEDSTTMEVD